MSVVHVVVPAGLDDPMRPSGGNVYDRQICHGLAGLGWSVLEHPVAGEWPWPGGWARADLAGVLGEVPDGGLVLLDGLVASGLPGVVAPQADRLRLVVLLHMPLGAAAPHARAAEQAVLSSAAAVVTTSRWTSRWLIDQYAVPSGRIHVVQPGAELAELAPGSISGGELLCVAGVTAAKGYDLLVAALSLVADLSWRCTCVGALDLDPGFADRLRGRIQQRGLADRIRFTGPLQGTCLDAAYNGADVLVSASRAESYGMVVTEALARGLPVIATRTGGVPEALGRADGGIPGLLGPPEDSRALAAALRTWLGDAGQRERLRKAAQARRLTLSDWSHTSRRLSRILTEVAR